MTLHLHRAVDTSVLADGLAELLNDPLPDPLLEELVVVPAKGIERWLTQRLSHRLGRAASPLGTAGGVCAGVRFVAPSSLVSLLTGTSASWDARSQDPYSLEHLTWAVLRVIDRHLDEDWLGTVARHLGRHLDGRESDLRLGRRYAVARHLATLFDSYARQRPALLTAWRKGDLVHDEGDLDWQAPLWRHVVDEIGHPPPDERHAEILARLRESVEACDLPPRVSLFGHTRIAATEIDLLTALGTHRDVHLWLPQASPAAWERLAPAVAAGTVPRSQDTSVAAVRHPLLASLGRDSRELQRSLARSGVLDHGDLAGRGRSASSGTGPGRLLHMLQHDLACDRPADAQARAERGVVDVEHDDSIRVYACHGPARQVEALRDALGGLLQDDPTLEPRDILVMCPDIEAYAPLFSASFGLGEELGTVSHPAHGFRVRLADRSLRATNPLFDVAWRLLDLAGGRVTVSQVLDLAEHPAVARRFRFDEDALEKVTAWVETAGIRWGLDADHRAEYRLDAFSQNTWRAGLDRLLLGVTMAESLVPDEDLGGAARSHVGEVLPVDDVGSGDIDLVGRFVEFLDRLETALEALQRADDVARWTTALADGVGTLTAVPETDAWQGAQLERELASVTASADGAVTLRLADVRRLLDRRLEGRPTRSNFRTGTLTVCTMVPMRSVPHRVVALVGLDDGVFPRSNLVDGDDVLARNPLTGERDRRSEDRQLLLDAVMAARDHLIVTYTGASDVDGSSRPPAVPVGELLDTVAGLAEGIDRTPRPPAAHALVTAHPLQPFDPVLLSRTDPFTFDHAAYRGALASAGPRVERRPFLARALPPPPGIADGDVTLEQLHAFFAHPARTFLRERLDVGTRREEEDDLDAIPVELDGLEKWSVGDRILRDALAGVHPRHAREAEAARGLLPPGFLGERTLDDVLQVVHALMQASGPLRVGPPGAVDLTVELRDGRRLTGTVADVYGTDVVAVTYSALSAKSRIRAWIDLLALTVAHPDTPWTAHVVAKSRGGALHRAWGPLPPAAAADWLADLLDVRDRGLCEPIPLPPKTSLAYAEAVHRRRLVEEEDPSGVRSLTSPVEAARAAWETDRNRADAFPGEHADPVYERLHGANARLDVLLTDPGPDETWNTEARRLGRYAVRVWDPEITNGRRA